MTISAPKREREEGRAAYGPNTKQIKTSPGKPPLPTRDFPWLRSGCSFAHQQVVEAATMQVASLADFKLKADVRSEHDGGSTQSSQTTVTEPSSPATPRPAYLHPAQPDASPPTPLGPASPARASPAASTIEAPRTPQRLPSSQASTIEAPWTPQGTATDELRAFGIGATKIPLWFSECYESDGYDTDALICLGRTAPLSPIRSVASSPGFCVVGDTHVHSAKDEWVPEKWPSDVTFLVEHFNPHKWKFPRVSVGCNNGVGCGCKLRCNVSTCANAKSARFCVPENCSFRGTCGNALSEYSSLAVSRNTRTGMRGLIATKAIPAGEIIGQYLGEMDVFGAPCRNGPANEGYRMHLKTKTTGGKHAGINAATAGGKLRMLNHSCKPAARFHEVQTGRRPL